MSPDELLKPRVKVMMDYLNSDFAVGTIIEAEEKTTFFTGDLQWITKPILHKNGGKRSQYCMLIFDAFPHIFKPLNWWEERDLDSMPRYVRCIIDGGSYALPKGGVGKVFRWREQCADVFVDYKDNCCQTEDFIPATEQEYEEYVNKKQLQ